MSLEKVLSSKAVDEGLDNIFKSSAGPSTLATTSPPEAQLSSRKRKTGGAVEDKSAKKPRRSEDDAKKSKGKEKGKKRVETVDEDEGKEAKEEVSAKEDGHETISSDDDQADSTVPEHESLKKSNRRKKDGSKKTKYVPEGETREQRDARSIFIGNLPVAVVKSKALTKQLKRHIISHVHSAKIESIRFRSVAFLNPTSTLEEEGDGKPSTKQKRQQKRTADWREQKPDAGWTSNRDKTEIEEEKKGEKSYMTPAEKRRLAAIKGDLHEHTAATTNAYVVFAHPVPVTAGAPETHVSRKEVMDPFAAAREAVSKIDRTLFVEHMIRVDFVGKAMVTTQDSNVDSGALTDPRLSIFVGNLDFASSEDDVRAFFEKVMLQEQGNSGSEVKADVSDDEDEDEHREKNGNVDTSRKSGWVTRVRIVRDRETQLGKGFAYVQFCDRDCVDEVLALEADKLKFAKRTLRVQRCKSLSGATAKSRASQPTTRVTSGVTTNPRSRAPIVALPKGDPTLGARLAGLSKDSRKEAKAADVTRVARRLAKKKARAALEKVGMKEKRVRERKDKKGKATVNTGRKNGKRRVRSERNTEKRNLKK